MNRQQRRATKEERIPPTTIQCGHNGEHVILLFDKPTKAIAMTEEQALDHIMFLRGAMAALRAHNTTKGINNA